MGELLFADEVYRVVGAAIEVYNELRSGFLESVYQEAMEIELAAARIEFSSQVPLRIKYKDRILEKRFCADFVCFGTVLVEIKAIRETSKIDEAQVLNYLRATGLQVGLLINFGDPGRLDWSRIVNSHQLASSKIRPIREDSRSS